MKFPVLLLCYAYVYISFQLRERLDRGSVFVHCQHMLTYIRRHGHRQCHPWPATSS